MDLTLEGLNYPPNLYNREKQDPVKTIKQLNHNREQYYSIPSLRLKFNFDKTSHMILVDVIIKCIR